MLSPHVTRSPTPLSRLSQLGMAATWAELERLVPQGKGWHACEVDNLNHDAGRWPAALVRPSALVQAWLGEAASLTSLTTRWGQTVSGITCCQAPGQPALWQAMDPDGAPIARAPVMVVCAALGSVSMLLSHPLSLAPEAFPLRPVKGEMSLAALEGPPLAVRPMRLNGVFVPQYEDTGLAPRWPSRIWAMGATYARGDTSTHSTPEGHEGNALSLKAIHPQAEQRFRQAALSGQLLGWAEVRCASLDRLPLAGAVPHTHALWQRQEGRKDRHSRSSLADVPRVPGLFMLSALGSRGITLAHWCAQVVASRIDASPLAFDADLLAAIDPARFAWKQARRQTVA
jgi:tRNA 5-methylaminomethyl-2-thiouridine biosynthesis bifunctional protein